MRYVAVVAAAVVVVLSAAYPLPASAESEDPFIASVIVGYSRMFETTAKLEVTGTQSDADVAPDGAGMVGGGIYYKVRPGLAVGGEAAWFNLGRTGTRVGQKHELDSVPVTAQVAYYIPTHYMTPFVTAGLGSYHLRYYGSFDGVVTTISANRFGFNLGGGLKFPIDENVGIGIDVRFHIVTDPTLEKTVGLGDIRAEMDSWNMVTVAGRLFVF